MSPTQPHLTLLSEEQKNRVHAWSLRILSETGVRVDSIEARRLLLHPGGCPVDDVWVRIPAELVTWALHKAPDRVEVHDRLGRYAFTLGAGGDGTRFGIGVTNLYYQDPKTDAIAPFTREHMALSTRLGHGLAEYDVVESLDLVPGNIYPVDLTAPPPGEPGLAATTEELFVWRMRTLYHQAANDPERANTREALFYGLDALTLGEIHLR